MITGFVTLFALSVALWAAPTAAKSLPDDFASKIEAMVRENDYRGLSASADPGYANVLSEILEWKFKSSKDRSKIQAYAVPADDPKANQRAKSDSEKRGTTHEPLAIRTEKLLKMYKGLGSEQEYRVKPTGSIIVLDDTTIASFDYGELEGAIVITYPTDVAK